MTFVENAKDLGVLESIIILRTSKRISLK